MATNLTFKTGCDYHAKLKVEVTKARVEKGEVHSSPKSNKSDTSVDPCENVIESRKTILITDSAKNDKDASTINTDTYGHVLLDGFHDNNA